MGLELLKGEPCITKAALWLAKSHIVVAIQDSDDKIVTL